MKHYKDFKNEDTFVEVKVSGFTFIRNAIKLDYPVKEAILSILPLVDEMIVASSKIFVSKTFYNLIVLVQTAHHE
jgi:hypothetical protein